MNRGIEFSIILVACTLWLRPAVARDTDNVSRLDLIDHPQFDSTFSSSAHCRGLGTEDLDRVNPLNNEKHFGLLGNQIASLESGGFEGLTSLDLYGNQLISIENEAFVRRLNTSSQH